MTSYSQHHLTIYIKRTNSNIYLERSRFREYHTIIQKLKRLKIYLKCFIRIVLCYQPHFISSLKPHEVKWSSKKRNGGWGEETKFNLDPPLVALLTNVGFTVKKTKFVIFALFESLISCRSHSAMPTFYRRRNDQLLHLHPDDLQNYKTSFNLSDNCSIKLAAIFLTFWECLFQNDHINPCSRPQFFVI